ncbi:MAG: hydantoinase/oxoprolinase family protein [Anaerolineae bacterium]
MMAVALGIDTGGTYTDAVLMDYETNLVLAHAKALTTKYNLSIGIRQAITDVLKLVPAEICLVSLSTTLATNAIVEGNGAPVCTLLIGYDLVFDGQTDLTATLGTKHYALIVGGHEANGDERFSLDVSAASRAIVEYAPFVAGFAVSSYFGTRNPAHEIAVRDLVAQLSGKPVTCGHELSSQLDALRRAVTATLNASLIPLLCDLIAAVRSTLDERGITAPLMVVKGDGSLVSASFASERPIETILSGPAASVVGAQHLGGGGNVVVVDMGGTTTDIAILKDGRPRLNLNGAQVGRWRTMVEAIDVQTVGLGGDSRVCIDSEGELQIGPRRVVPLSLLALQYPQVLAVLREQAGRTRLGPTTGEFLLLQRADWAQETDQPPFVTELLTALKQGPQSVEWVNKLVRHPELYARYLDHMERIGVLTRSGFTPSDAAHCLGLYNAWDPQASELGAAILAKRLQITAHDLCQTVRARTSQQIASEIVAKLLHDDGLNGQHNILQDALVARALHPLQAQQIQCSLTLTSNIVAIGAPVQTYFPAVAEMLHSQVQIPRYAEVANAVGAVVGGVVMAVRLLVEPQADQAGYRVHTPEQVHHLMDLDSAFQFAEDRGRELALALAQKAGANDIRLQVQRCDHRAPLADGWGDDMYIGSEFTVTAIGRPRLAAG